MMKRGEIYMVQFEPSVGREYNGYRPALIVQDAELDTSPLVTIIPFTTKTTKGYMSDVLIKRDAKNRLAKDSIALPRFVTSFDRGRFKKLVGSVASEVMRQIDASMKAHLGLR